MSWNSYVESLMSGETITGGAVCGLDGQIWAVSPGLNITQQEVQVLIAGLNDSKSLTENGVIVAGTKYFFLQSDHEQIQGKKGQTGVSVAKSTQCVLISLYEGQQGAGSCRKTTETLRDYLKSVGY